MTTIIAYLIILTAIWTAWRWYSQRSPLPGPAESAWLVELENPLARATRSEEVVQQLAPQPGARVIDIGCGPGRVTIPLARAIGPGGEVIALDVQAGMLAKVAQKAEQEEVGHVRLMESGGRSARMR